MENQHCHKKAKKSHTTQDAEVVDIIFLDIDGVLLPFGGDSGKEYAHADGCIFPDRAMNAITSLLKQMSELEIAMPNTTKDEDKSKQQHAPTMKCNPKLVLSSTWRAQPTFIKDILSSFECYAEANPKTKQVWHMHSQDFFDICDPVFHSTRHEEIYHWINANTNTSKTNEPNKCKGTNIPTKQFTIRSWIALDDEELVDVPDAFPDTDKHAVKTVSSVGLVESDVEYAVKLVADQMMEVSELISIY